MLGRILRQFARRIGIRGPAPDKSGGKESYNAVTVALTARCCDAARATHARPILVRTLPRLPLPDCTMPDQCRCEFREWPDRRIGERRLPASAGPSDSGVPPEGRRERPDRRRS